jgi:hypothetical protein
MLALQPRRRRAWVGPPIAHASAWASTGGAHAVIALKSIISIGGRKHAFFSV